MKKEVAKRKGNSPSIASDSNNPQLRSVNRSPEYIGVTVDRIRLAFAENQPVVIPYLLRFEICFGFVTTLWGTYISIPSEQEFYKAIYFVICCVVSTWGVLCIVYFCYHRFYLKEKGTFDVEEVIKYIEHGRKGGFGDGRGQKGKNNDRLEK